MRKRTKRRIPLYLLAFLLAYAILGFWVVPRVIHSQVLKHLPEALNREVSLETVRLNPFTFTLEMQNLAVQDPDGSPFFSFSLLSVNYDPSRFYRKGFLLKAVEVHEPFFKAHRLEDGKLNFSDILQENENNTEEKQAKESPILHIDQLRVSDGTVVFVDSSPDSRYNKEIRNLSFSLRDFSTAPGREGIFSIKAASGNTEAFILTGQVGLEPLKLSGQVVVDSLELQEFMPYAERYIAGTIKDGRLDLQLEYTITLEGEAPRILATNGELALRDFSMVTPDSEVPLIALEAFQAGFFEVDLARRRALAGHVTLDGLTLNGHRHADGVTNFEKLYIPPPSGEARPVTSSDQTQWIVRLADFLARDTTLQWRDDSLPEPVNLQIEASLTELLSLSNQPEETYSLRVEVQNGDAGSAIIEGEGYWIPVSGRYTLTLEKWELSDLNPYLKTLAGLELASGQVSADTSVEFSLSEGQLQQLAVNAHVDTNRFEVWESEQGLPLASWGRLSLRDMNFNYPDNSLRIATVEYLDPVLNLTLLENGQTNLSRLKGSGQNSEEPVKRPTPGADKKQKDLAIRVDTLAINNGRVVFEDQQQDPVVELSADSINGSINGLSTDDSARPSLSLDMNLLGVTPLKAEGTVNLLAGEPFADVLIDMKGLELSPFASYFSRYVGFNLEQGILNLDLAYKLENQQLVSNNLILINQLTLGQETGSPDAVNLPVLLAISLLKDAKGNIELDLPIQGDISDPSFSFGNVIARTVSNLIVKLATSPFSILASLVNVSAEELQSVSFPPAGEQLEEKAKADLDAVATAMSKRPGIRLELSAVLNAMQERPALTRKKLQNHLEENTRLPESFEGTSEEAYQERVERAYRSKLLFPILPRELPPFQEMEASLLKDFAATDADLTRLSRGRMEAVRNYLVEEKDIPAERILTGETGESDSGTGKVRLDIR